MRTIRLETVIAAPIGDCFGLPLSVDAHAARSGGGGTSMRSLLWRTARPG
jgi:hypothetical protein